MCCDANKFCNFVPVSNQKVRLATDETAEIQGKGTVRLEVETPDGKKKKIRLENTLCVPSLRTNFLSITKTVDTGHKVIFEKSHAEITNQQGESVMRARRRGGSYFLEPLMESTATASERNVDLMEWHERYGHLNEADLRKLISKGMAVGFPTKLPKEPLVCEICILGKQVRTPFPKSSENKSENVLDRIHSDVCGPMRILSIGGAKYFVTFIDEKSRWVEVRFLKSKGDVKQEFLKFKANVETQQERKVKVLRTDNGLEYCGKEFTETLDLVGISRERTVDYTPQQNGVGGANEPDPGGDGQVKQTCHQASGLRRYPLQRTSGTAVQPGH